MNWGNGRPYRWSLPYDDQGAATVTARDGETVPFASSWPSGMDAGNAVRFLVKNSARMGTSSRVTVETINGSVISRTLETAGNDLYSEAAAPV